MNLDYLKHARNLLLKTALVSLLLTWILAAATIAMWDFWSATTSQWFRTPTSELGPMITNWFALVKFYVIFVLLAPALALHWEIKKKSRS